MSIDFDSAALQTQHEEEEYDQEDYAREQELHKLLTDLPDDMLEDSRDSSPELDHSACSNHDPGNSQQPAWPQQTVKCSDHQRPGSHEENYEDNYDQGSYHDEYAYEDGAVRINGVAGHPQSQAPPHTWNQQGQEYQYNHGDYTYCSVGTEKSAASNDFSPGEGYEHEPCAHRAPQPAEVYRGGGGQRDEQSRDQNSAKNHFQNFESGEPGDRMWDPYKASYKPYQAASQPTMFQPETAQQDGHYDQLQRDFLDSAQDTVDNQQLAQVQILNKAQLRQIEDLEHKLEDSRRNMRYLEHQFAIVKDEKEGLAVSLKESSRLIEETKEREGHLTNDVKSLELQVQTLTERDRENVKKQRVAEAAVASLQQQMTELCRSDTLSRAREQHDRDLSVVREQHEAKLLVLQQKLDSCSQALEEQAEVGQRLREQVKQLERQREEEQVERAGVVNTLTQRLEESQQQCAKLLQTGSVLEMSQMQIKLQQAQSAKTLSENMNQVLQDDLRELKEQISLYESAVKHGALTLDLNGDWEDQLSESCVDLGIKKANWKNGRLHSSPLAELVDPKLPREEALRELRAELQRCLASLRGKRQRIGQLQEQLQGSQGRVDELQAQLDRAQLTNTTTTITTATIRGASSEKHMDLSAASQKELLRLQEDQKRLQEHVEILEKKNKELKQSEEKVRSANTELCTKMREMIQELDQEKQEAAERYERTQQQFRDDVVNRVRAELTVEHAAQVEQLTAEHQQQIQQLQSKLSEVNGEMLAVQECYISVCKEKDKLEVNLHSRMEEEEAKMRENELKMREESSASLEMLRTELESQHQTAVEQLKALWSKEQKSEVQQRVQSQLASARAVWQEEREQTERAWAERLEEARRRPHAETRDEASQTDDDQAGPDSLSREELESALNAERLRLLREANAAQRRAVEEVRKHVQRELQEKHLEDMAKQVEGAVTRAYSRWLEDLPSLPEYKANLQREREKWEELHEQRVQEQAAAEEQRRGAGPEEQRRRVEELEEELASSRSQLERVWGEQAALLKAELAAARAAWDGDRQREASSLRARHEQERGELERSLQQALLRAREEFERQREQLAAQKEAELQRALRERREEWTAQQESRGQAARRQGREEALQELRAGLAEVRGRLLGDGPTQQQTSGGEEERRDSGPAKEGTVRRVLQTECQDMLSTAVAQAKKEWKRVNEERLGRALRDAQECHEREITHIHNTVSQRGEEGRCGKQCAETVAKLQKKNQDLQRHLEKACRQLQHTVRENKASTQRLKDEHETLRKEKEDHLLRLEEVKRSSAQEASGGSDNLQAGLEEMKEQYMRAIGKIRGDMLRYLQESKERASEMIRVEVQRERQDTARRMRRYYLTCLQELLDEGGQTTGAEKMILSAASKLTAMARVLETPAKRKPAKTHSLHSSSSNTKAATENNPAGSSVSIRHRPPETSAPETRCEKRTAGGKAYDKHDPTTVAKTRTKPPSRALRQDPFSSPAHHLSLKASHQTEKAFPTDFTSANVTLRNQSREAYLQGMDSGKADHPVASELQRKPFLIRETPVRDQGQSDWSSVSNASLGDAFVPTHSHRGRETESVRPCPLSAASLGDLGDFGVFTAEDSDVTVYKEVAGVPSLAFPGVRMSTRREAVPGSEGNRQAHVCSKSLFSELKLQQDSGFDSPFSLQK